MIRLSDLIFLTAVCLCAYALLESAEKTKPFDVANCLTSTSVEELRGGSWVLRFDGPFGSEIISTHGSKCECVSAAFDAAAEASVLPRVVPARVECRQSERQVSV